MSHEVSIVFASDDHYAQHVAVAMASVLLNTEQPGRIVFYLIDDGIAPPDKEKIAQTVEALQGHVRFLEPRTEQSGQYYVSGLLSRAAYLRLDIPNLLPPEADRAIYLDCDLLVLDEIGLLWQMDLEGKPLGAVPDLGIMASRRSRKEKAKYLGFSMDEPYFNSGVLVFDLAQWRRQGYSEQAKELAEKSDFPHHDQDALNKVFQGQWMQLPLRWNVIPPVWNMFLKILARRNYRKSAIEARQAIAILHYAGGYTPWEYELHEGFNERYYEYLSRTAFREAAMPQFDSRRKHRSIRRQMIRLKLGNFWEKLFGRN